MLKFCSEPWDTINIHYDGQIGSCLCAAWNHVGWIGNIRTQTLKDIVNSYKITQFRKTIIDQSFKYCSKTDCGKLWNLDQVDDLDSVQIHQTDLPSSLHLHLDKNCNLKCQSCRNSNIYSKEVDQRTYDILSKLTQEYQDYQKPVFVYGDGIGDIFASSAYQKWLREDQLPKCFKFCITTNGNLITKNLDLLTKLQSQIDIVIVSFDASTSSTYKEIRGGDFGIVVEGVRQMVNLGISVSTQYVVQYKNYREILDYVALVKELGVKHIGLQLLDFWPHMNQDWWQANQLNNNPDVDYAWLINALTILKQDPTVGLCGGLKNLINQH